MSWRPTVPNELIKMMREAPLRYCGPEPLHGECLSLCVLVCVLVCVFVWGEG